MSDMTFEEKMKAAASVFDNPLPPPVKKIPNSPIEKSLQRKEDVKELVKIEPIKNTSPQKHLNFLPKVTRLADEQLESISGIVRQISKTRTINSNEIRGIKRDRISDCSLIRALLDATLPSLEAIDWAKTPILTEEDLKKVIKEKLINH